MMAQAGPSKPVGPILVTASPMRKYVAVKRKANEEPSIDRVDASISKRFKLVASVLDKEQLRRVVQATAPMMVDGQDFEVEDYDEFILKVKPDSFPKPTEVVTCNGVPLVPVEALNVEPRPVASRKNDGGIGDQDDGSETPYMYDVYWYTNEGDERENELVSYLIREQEAYEQDYSSNDEENPNNEYPDEYQERYGGYGYGSDEESEEFDEDRIIRRSPLDDYLCREDWNFNQITHFNQLDIHDEEDEEDADDEENESSDSEEKNDDN